MNVISHNVLPRRLGAGCCAQTVADAALCQAPFEVQVQSIEAGAATAQVAHAEARVVLALEGGGKLVLDSGSQRFNAPCTLRIAAGARHHFVNHAATPMQLVTVFVPAPPGEELQR